MRIARFTLATGCTLFILALAVHAQQAAPRPLIGGTLTPARPDARGWGWAVKASINAKTPRPFYNRAKELLFQDKQITSYTISSYNPDLYCEVGRHFDYVWFEMQHSTMSWDDVRRMMVACRQDVGAVEMPEKQTGSPMTYVVDGRQYIVVAVSGSDGAELLAYALP